MNKYANLNSSKSDINPRLPRIKNINFSTATASPTNSGNSSFTQPSFKFAPQNRPIKIPRLNSRPVLSSKSRNIEYTPGDTDHFEDYLKNEIKRSRQLPCDRFPYWYMDTLLFGEIKNSKEDLINLSNLHEDRQGFSKWVEESIQKLENL